MKKIEEYSQDELIALYKRLNVYTTTWWFKYYKTYDKYYKEYRQKTNKEEEPVIIWKLDNTKLLNQSMSFIDIADHERFFISSREATIERTIEELKSTVMDDKTGREIKKLTYEKEALRITKECLYWFSGLYERDVEKYEENNPNLCSPDEIMEELHFTDEYNIKNGLATDYQVYQFVWETLQYLSKEQLSKLLSFADRGLKNKWEKISSRAGRKSRECPIRQVDIETGAVINTYSTRNDLMAKTGIKKSHLAQCIKTAKDNPDRRNEWKKWKGENGRLYGFVEYQ